MTTSAITGAVPGVSTYTLLRDETTKMAGVPFRRLLVYRLEVPLPMVDKGVTLFSVQAGYTISSITIAASKAFKYDSSYILYDIADGETIGIAEVRAGHTGTLPMAIPDLPAGLSGPSTVYIRPSSGIQGTDGLLVFQISIYGPADITGSGLSVDINQDGVPDELAEELIPLPPFSVMESYDDFFIGYTAGVNGDNQQ